MLPASGSLAPRLVLDQGNQFQESFIGTEIQLFETGFTRFAACKVSGIQSPMSFATGDQSDEIVTAAERLDPVVVVFKMHRNLPQIPPLAETQLGCGASAHPATTR